MKTIIIALIINFIFILDPTHVTNPGTLTDIFYSVNEDITILEYTGIQYNGEDHIILDVGGIPEQFDVFQISSNDGIEILGQYYPGIDSNSRVSFTN